MIYCEVYGDLFNVDKKYYLAHCISADFALGKGIAVEFNKRYDELLKVVLARCTNPFEKFAIEKYFETMEGEWKYLYTVKKDWPKEQN